MGRRIKNRLDPDRYFDPDPKQRSIARELYESVSALPRLCPHGHVDPRLFAREDAALGTPAELFILPDHYVLRMLYSQGISMEALGVPRLDGGPVEQDHRKVWQLFSENFYLFRGTPTGIWLTEELHSVFGIEEKLNGKTAQKVCDRIEAELARPAFRPRALFERFNVEVLCTTDAATDPLSHHRAIKESGWKGRVLPTFRPDALVNLSTPGWRDHLNALSDVSGMSVDSYAKFIAALENRRGFFRKMGARATDHAALNPYTEELSSKEAETIFQKALKGRASDED